MTKAVSIASKYLRNRSFRFLYWLLVLSILQVHLSSCHDHGSTQTPPVATLSSIGITGTATLVAGQSAQLKARATYSDGSTKDVTSTSTWASTDSSVAKVSSGGSITAIGSGTATITAALSGVSSGIAVSVAAKTLTSVSVSPLSATLPLSVRQQFSAIGTYNDDTSSDVTSDVVWMSSLPSVASITGAGVVSTLSPGETLISATDGNLQSSMALNVGNATGGPIIVNDLTDNRVMFLTDDKQNLLTFFGTRDANGIPLSLYKVREDEPDGAWEILSLDPSGRPTQLRMSDNSQINLNWTSATSAIVSVVTADGKDSLGATIGDQTGTSPAVSPLSVSEAKPTPAAAQPSITPIDISVTSCGVPEQFAEVSVFPGGGEVLASSTAGKPGHYTASVPSGALNTVSNIAQAMPAVFNSICSAVNDINSALGSSNPGTTLGPAICSAITAVAYATGNPASPAVSVACSASVALITTVATNACQMSTGSNRNFNFYLALSNVFKSATIIAGLPAVDSQNVSVSPDLLAGVYPPVSIELGCPPVSYVQVTPARTTISVGDSIQLTGNAFAPNQEIIRSSAITFLWNPFDGAGNASISSPTAFPGGSVATVKGLNPGTTTFTVTELSSAKQGTGLVMVNPAQVISGLWSGSYTWDNVGLTVSFALCLNQTGSNISGNGDFSYPNFINGILAFNGTLSKGNVKLSAPDAKSPGGVAFTIDANVVGTSMNGRITSIASPDEGRSGLSGNLALTAAGNCSW